MLVDSKQRVWVASYNVGLRCFTRDGKQIALYTTRNSSLSNDIILSIVERKGQIWLGTDGGGIDLLNPETQQFSSLKHIPEKSIHHFLITQSSVFIMIKIIIYGLGVFIVV